MKKIFNRCDGSFSTRSINTDIKDYPTQNNILTCIKDKPKENYFVVYNVDGKETLISADDIKSLIELNKHWLPIEIRSKDGKETYRTTRSVW